ncbi:MAG TPA: hypothetical protein VFV87_03250 [Pirellulaceae bacterium]|nr:hypothetical protein [Pirellulaceae bacterium]
MLIAFVVSPWIGLLAALWLYNLYLPSLKQPDDPSIVLACSIVGLAVMAIASWAFMSVAPAILAVPLLCSRLQMRRRRFAVRTRSLRQFVLEYLWHCFAVSVLIAPFVGLACLTLAGDVSSPEKALYFFLGWWSTILVATLIYITPPLRWLLPWLQ